MIELYVGISLIGLGYILNQQNATKTNPVKQINVNELPSAKNMYDSTHLQTTKKIEQQLANRTAAQRASQQQQKDIKVVPREPGLYVQSALTGTRIPVADFTHNNMQPFFKGASKQEYSDNSRGNATLLESFTGVDPFRKPKREITSLFSPTKGLTNIAGSQTNTDAFQQRYEVSKKQTNVLPFEQIRVGPGLNRGYGSAPTGGFQQRDAQEYAKPRDTDAIRASNKPKVTYTQRVVAGQKGTARGVVPPIAKNKAVTFFENTPDRYFKTTGSFLKDKQRPEVEVKYTPKQDSQTSYTGTPYANAGDTQRPEHTASAKMELRGPHVTAPNLQQIGSGTKYDYGKSSIMVYANERDVTTVRSHQGNLAAIAKAFTAPFEDLVRLSKKEYLVEAPRERGHLQATMPAKLTVRDPNDILRTTIKETTIHDADTLNFKGHRALTTFDPNDVMRTTAKETMLHDADYLNIKSQRGAVQSRDSDRVAKPTVRETTEPIEHQRNMGAAKHVPTARDPNNAARTTTKETTLDTVHDVGNVQPGSAAAGGYVISENFVPDTQKAAVTSQSDYAGNPHMLASDAYRVLDVDARATQKASITADSEYVGAAAGSASDFKPTSYADMYNATIDELKEELLHGRAPTAQGAKVATGKAGVAEFDSRRFEQDEEAVGRILSGMDRVVNVVPDANKSIVLTKERNMYDNQRLADRNNADDVLDMLDDNPYVVRVDS